MIKKHYSYAQYMMYNFYMKYIHTRGYDWLQSMSFYNLECSGWHLEKIVNEIRSCIDFQLEYIEDMLDIKKPEVSKDEIWQDYMDQWEEYEFRKSINRHIGQAIQSASNVNKFNGFVNKLFMEDKIDLELPKRKTEREFLDFYWGDNKKLQDDYDYLKKVKYDILPDFLATFFEPKQ